MTELSLSGRSILIAEDEYYVAGDLRRELTRLGATVIGPAPTLERVLDLIEDAEQIDGAVLDVNLGGEMVYPAADLLTDRRIPFLFATGYDRSAIPSRFDEIGRCEKPLGSDKIAQALTELIVSDVPAPPCGGERRLRVRGDGR